MRALVISCAVLAVAGTALNFMQLREQRAQLHALGAELTKAQAAPQLPALGSAATALSWSLQGSQLARQVATELVPLMKGMAQPQPTASTKTDQSPKEEAELDPVVQHAALEQATTIVDQVLRRRKLEAGDVETIRDLRNKIGNVPEYQALRRRIIVAINRDELETPADVHYAVP
jgi:hypothetical protein